MLDSSPNILVSLFRVMRLALHLFYYVLLAIFYPGFNRALQRYLLRTWSKHLLAILNIGIYTEGEQTTPSESGFLMIANHTSWLDIFVLNALHPACFVAKAEVRHWPLIGWLCQRSGTIFIERTKRKDTAAISLQISALLEQGICVALFPEGTSTDGKQVGHFHSSLIQPAIDAGVKICPIALQYRDASGRTSTLAEFTGDMTLADSVWRILRGTQLSAVAAFTPLLTSSDTHRRALARTAQQTISDKLHEPIPAQNFSQLPCALPRALLSAQSAYVLLLDPILHNLPQIAVSQLLNISFIPLQQPPPKLRTSLFIHRGDFMQELNRATQTVATPRLITSLARNQTEVLEAQRLRYKVFAKEMGAHLPGDKFDIDAFDDFCEHLIVRESEENKVVGTYRILPPDQAEQCGGYYAQTEFDITRLLHLSNQMVEVGRSCVHRDFRDGATISQLWSGLAQYMLQHRYEYLIGCASISMADGGHMAASLYRKLHLTHGAPVEYHVFPRCPLPLHALNQNLDVPPPPLLKGYLRLGAYICGEPAWDPEFNTADLLMLLPMSRMDSRYAKHFLK